MLLANWIFNLMRSTQSLLAKRAGNMMAVLHVLWPRWCTVTDVVLSIMIIWRLVELSVCYRWCWLNGLLAPILSDCFDIFCQICNALITVVFDKKYQNHLTLDFKGSKMIPPNILRDSDIMDINIDYKCCICFVVLSLCPA